MNNDFISMAALAEGLEGNIASNVRNAGLHGEKTRELAAHMACYVGAVNGHRAGERGATARALEELAEALRVTAQEVKEWLA